MITDCIYSRDHGSPHGTVCAILAYKHPVTGKSIPFVGAGVCAICPKRKPWPEGKRPECVAQKPVPVTIGAKPAPPPAPDELSDGLPLEVLTDAERVGLGDLVEAGAKIIGADKLAKAYERITGLKCGCGWRRNLLNRVRLWKRNGES